MRHALRELLSLYVELGDAAARREIEGVRSVASRSVTRRLPFDGPASFARGSRSRSTATRLRSRARAPSARRGARPAFLAPGGDQLLHRNRSQEHRSGARSCDGRRDSDSVRSLEWLRELASAPFRFDFHQALRRLEVAFGELPRWGQAARPRDEPVRFGQDPSLAFAPSAVGEFRPPTDDRPGQLLVAFFGLFGPNGPLPPAPHGVRARAHPALG